MSPRVSADRRSVRKLFPGVVCLAAMCCEVQVQAQVDHRYAAVDRVTTPDDGIALNMGSDISVRKTSNALFVQVLHGEALLDARELGSRAMTVRAGNAQVRSFDAVVCVGVERDRASIDVIDGAARVANVDARDHVINEVTLRPGARVEIAVRGAVVSFRIANSGVGEQRPCRWGAKTAQSRDSIA